METNFLGVYGLGKKGIHDVGTMQGLHSLIPC